MSVSKGQAVKGVKQTEKYLFYFKENGITLLDPMVTIETCEPNVARSDFSRDVRNSNALCIIVSFFQCWQTSFFWLKKKYVCIKKHMPLAIKRKKT